MSQVSLPVFYCLPFKTSLTTQSCAKRYLLANSEHLPTNSECGQEISTSACRKCETGLTNAEQLHPEDTLIRRMKLRQTVKRLKDRTCTRCKEPFSPTNPRQKRCAPCIPLYNREYKKDLSAQKRQRGA